MRRPPRKATTIYSAYSSISGLRSTGLATKSSTSFRTCSGVVSIMSAALPASRAASARPSIATCSKPYIILCKFSGTPSIDAVRNASDQSAGASVRSVWIGSPSSNAPKSSAASSVRFSADSAVISVSAATAASSSCGASGRAGASAIRASAWARCASSNPSSRSTDSYTSRENTGRPIRDGSARRNKYRIPSVETGGAVCAIVGSHLGFRARMVSLRP